jgi:hypothetical protein
MPRKTQVRETKNEKLWGMFIPAGLFVGMGIGILFDRFIAGLFLGLGIGFVLALLGRIATRK